MEEKYFNEYDIESNSTELLETYFEIYRADYEKHGGASNYEMVKEIAEELDKRKEE